MPDDHAAHALRPPRRSVAILRSPAFIAGIVSLGVSGVVGPTVNGFWSRHNAALQAHDDAVRRAVSRFVLEAEAFGPFATNFVLGVSRDNRVDPEAYNRLAGNIVSQQASLEALMIKMPPDMRKKISRYEDALLALNSAMQKVHDSESMREFWERTSDLLVIRQDLMPRLEIDPA
jgi:hypothetical protein